MSLTYQIFSSPLGEVLVAGSGYAVSHVRLGTDKHQMSADFRMEFDATPMDKSGYIREACAALAGYLNGREARIDLAIQVEGTDFERKVWNQLRQIPLGHTMNYRTMAGIMGEPHAVQAVADACARNPVPLIIPSHRAGDEDGEALGFCWGPAAKHYLLELEKHYVLPQTPVS